MIKQKIENAIEWTKKMQEKHPVIVGIVIGFVVGLLLSLLWGCVSPKEAETFPSAPIRVPVDSTEVYRQLYVECVNDTPSVRQVVITRNATSTIVKRDTITANKIDYLYRALVKHDTITIPGAATVKYVADPKYKSQYEQAANAAKYWQRRFWIVFAIAAVVCIIVIYIKK
jgi:ElaB/YqjD/DUF883 family membrane-anchored ribosome-binding protein